tara:strand:- start:1684 stop:1980 length:297 start_codon:yes stop_codon:yes gene_type:complete
MDRKYNRWIGEYLRRKNGGITDQCILAVREMNGCFPELHQRWGYVELQGKYNGFCGTTDTLPHAWLITANNEIVDPTASQFKRKILKYIVVSEKPPKN